MNAIDTNIVVRFFVDDPHHFNDIQQRHIALSLLRQNCYISLTVILETVWVLSSHYKLAKDDIYRALNLLCRLSNIYIENQPYLEQALDYYQSGMDFADALHLVQSTHCQIFYTFDQKFIKKAQQCHIQNQVLAPQ